MRDKLIELLAKHCQMKDKRCVGCDEGEHYHPECKEERFGRIADHLLANGVIVLPCKVGDTVWTVKDPWNNKLLKKPLQAVINDVKNYSYGTLVGLLFDTKKYNGIRSYNVSDIGKTVFLSREDAEAALKEARE